MAGGLQVKLYSLENSPYATGASKILPPDLEVTHQKDLPSLLEKQRGWHPAGL